MESPDFLGNKCLEVDGLRNAQNRVRNPFLTSPGIKYEL